MAEENKDGGQSPSTSDDGASLLTKRNFDALDADPESLECDDSAQSDNDESELKDALRRHRLLNK